MNNGVLTNPGQSYSNVLAAQLVGVTLALGFDNYDPNFSSNTSSFGDLLIANGTFEGMSVSEFLELANDVIGGCQTGYSLSDLNATATAINENYDNGTVNNGYLVCNTFRLYAITVDSNVNCFGFQNGQVTVNVTGGEAPYTYALSNGMNSGLVNGTSYTFSGLAAGSYTVTVTDAMHVTASGNTTFTVLQPTQIQVATSSSSVRCFGESNGAASITSITGGVAPYTISWFNGSTDYSVEGLAAGTYSGTVTDALGCVMPFSVTIAQPQLLAAVATTTAVSCFGGNNGTATAQIPGGTAPYSVVWSTGATTTTITGLSAGVTYSATVTDAKGCQTSFSTTVLQPAPLQPSVVKENVQCFGGTAIAVVSATTAFGVFLKKFI